MNPSKLKETIRRLVGMDNKFKLAGDRSRYMPHQGSKECARRRKQMGGAS